MSPATKTFLVIAAGFVGGYVICNLIQGAAPTLLPATGYWFKTQPVTA